ncbi:MAG: hypothetical protein R3E91_03905 [Chlamydiales bacterium]
MFKSTFGFHSHVTVVKTFWSDETIKDEKAALFVNGFNLGGYFPIIGLYTGGVRLYSTLSNQGRWFRAPWQFRSLQIIRGTIECLGCGIIFLVIDVLATIFREIFSEDRQPAKIAELKI